MKQLDDILIPPSTSIFEAIKAIDAGSLQILLIVENGRLMGTVTDGDIRRSILRGLGTDEPVTRVMNANPVTVNPATGRGDILALMRAESIHCVPVINASGYVIGLETDSSSLLEGIEETHVVLMAGGLGMRMRPLTESVPKPMLAVNGKPMLDHIIARFIEQGFRRFYLSVNYKSELIRQYFGDGTDLGVNISYLDENKPLGTGGSLSLLPTDDISENIIVMNGDLLTTLNFRQLLDFHNLQGGHATMCVRDYSFQVPYGVVQVEGAEFVDIVEKPAHTCFVNAGVYVIRASELKHIPHNVFYDLPDIFGQLKTQGKRVNVFPVREDWRDVGSKKDYELANSAGREPG